MPTGSGNSHVICGLLAALALSQLGHYTFRVVYTNDRLLENDKPLISKVAKACNIADVSIKFVLAAKGMLLDADYDPRRITIIDEVDHCLIKLGARIFAGDDNKRRSVVIGLTATAAEKLNGQKGRLLKDFY